MAKFLLFILFLFVALPIIAVGLRILAVLLPIIISAVVIIGGVWVLWKVYNVIYAAVIAAKQN